jgi:SAM-dependent methyltransferase
MRHVALVPMMRRLLAALLAASLVAPAAFAQFHDIAPAIVDGKDVIWVPTPDAVVDRMLAMAQVGPRDFVVDLGSGDGRIPVAAAKRFGARALGIEYDDNLVAASRELAVKEGVAHRVEFRQADLFEVDFSQADVVTLYLLTPLNLKLRPKILAMKPGTRVVSHAFAMGDWAPDERARVAERDIYLWIVPARVEGRWRLLHTSGAAEPAREFVVKQRFQTLSDGGGASGGLTVAEGGVLGDRVRFVLGDERGRRRSYEGRVTGDRIEGISAGSWSAVRVR